MILPNGLLSTKRVILYDIKDIIYCLNSVGLLYIVPLTLVKSRSVILFLALPFTPTPSKQVPFTSNQDISLNK